MAKKTGDYVIPFDEKGNQMSYDYFYARGIKLPNFEFAGILKFLRFERGRSAANAIFLRQKTGTEVSVFLTDLKDMIPHMINGEIEGRFTFCKRGANYGCRLLNTTLAQ